MRNYASYHPDHAAYRDEGNSSTRHWSEVLHERHTTAQEHPVIYDPSPIVRRRSPVTRPVRERQQALVWVARRRFIKRLAVL